MLITIASGKGGTGKTTVATSLAVSYSEKIQLADCDVEVPNAHIFFDEKGSESENIYRFIPGIDNEKCTACGECERVCRYNAIAVVAGKVMIFPSLCHSCKGCLYACPENAVYDEKKLLGKIETNQVSKNLKLITGRLETGEMASPMLISKVKKKIDSNFHAIIDSPPGTSCSAIETMKDSDYVILVTEPTPFGLSDLKLAAETARLLKLPLGIIVNKHVEENKIIHKYAKEEKIPILMEIPYSRELAGDYSKGKLVVSDRNELMEKFRSTLENIIWKKAGEK